jgi:hypothetical protein
MSFSIIYRAQECRLAPKNIIIMQPQHTRVMRISIYALVHICILENIFKRFTGPMCGRLN